jgi:proteasome lid subunit RPN8/RPN11
MLYLTKTQIDKLLAHAKKEVPNEACGILAGRGRKVEAVYQMNNADRSSETFFMEPKQQLKVMKEIRSSGRELLGIYHSHLASSAYPSSRDVELAFYPEASYVIISIKDKDNPVIRSFKISKGRIQEEELIIT